MHLADEKDCLSLGEAVARDKVVKELAAREKFKDQAGVLAGADHVVKPDDVRVSQTLQSCSR